MVWRMWPCGFDEIGGKCVACRWKILGGIAVDGQAGNIRVRDIWNPQTRCLPTSIKFMGPAASRAGQNLFGFCGYLFHVWAVVVPGYLEDLGPGEPLETLFQNWRNDGPSFVFCHRSSCGPNFECNITPKGSSPAPLIMSQCAEPPGFG